jgi:hypothetical protein
MTRSHRGACAAVMALGALLACHRGVPGGGPEPIEGAYTFRVLGMNPAVRGSFTIVDGDVYMDIPSITCAPFDRARQLNVWIEASAFECRGFRGFPLVDIYVSLRDPVHYSTWSAFSTETPPRSSTECVQTGTNARGQSVCTAWATHSRGIGSSVGDKLDVQRRVPGKGGA